MSNVRIRSDNEPALQGILGRTEAPPVRAKRVFQIASSFFAASTMACSVYSDDPLTAPTDASNDRRLDGSGDGVRGSSDALDEEGSADRNEPDRRDGAGLGDVGRGGAGGAAGAAGAGGASGTSGAGGASGTGGTGGFGGVSGSSGAGGAMAGAAGAGGASGGDAGVADTQADIEGGPPSSDVAGDGTGRDGGCTGPTGPHDEDGDGVDDACDNCPSVPNANQADQGEIGAGLSADGVGDACDPRPNLAGEAILLFDPLTSGQLAAWSVYAGTWVAGADTVAETAVGNSQEIDRTDLTNQGDYLAETRFRFDRLPSPDSRTTLPFRMDTILHNGWGCAITTRSTLALSTIVNGAAGETAPPTTPIPSLQVGARYRILAGAYASNIYCVLPDTGQRVVRSHTSYPMGAPGLRTHLAAATFEYLLVYRLGGVLP
jgi:hypothetical protein